ncbi:uncharacterized protein METZ01_LOCUS170822 [marine metagenome]|uniref:Uncharacterized protein n=1 Tax=marine metagenome TaxID=408172 RepID=A0A382BVY4_9ZZZZ
MVKEERPIGSRERPLSMGSDIGAGTRIM